MNITLITGAVALALALLAGIAGLYGYAYQRGNTAANDRCDLAVDALKEDAAKTLTDETTKTRTAEQALQTQTNAQELQDAAHQKTVSALSDRLRGLAGQSGRLRDPNAQNRCGGSSGSPTGAATSAPSDRANDTTQADGLLSAELSGLLRERLKEADDINAAYASCRADALRARAE